MGISFDYDFGTREVLVYDAPKESTVIVDDVKYVPELTCKMEMVWEDDEGNELESSAPYFRFYKCSNCGEIMEHYKHEHWSYCPKCGARVVE